MILFLKCSKTHVVICDGLPYNLGSEPTQNEGSWQKLPIITFQTFDDLTSAEGISTYDFVCRCWCWKDYFHSLFSIPCCIVRQVEAFIYPWVLAYPSRLKTFLNLAGILISSLVV